MRIEQLIKFFLMFFPLCHNGLFAGNVVGNGGIFVKCEVSSSADPGAFSYELLDFFDQGAGSKGVDDALKLKSGSDIEIAREVVYRLSKVDRTRAARYRYWLEKFYREASFPSQQLSRTMDAGLISELPTGCELVQVAIQVAPVKEGDPRYFIDRLIWSQTSQLHRAGLIIHELAVRDARQRGVVTTQKLRKFVSFLFSKDLTTVSTKQYHAQLGVAELSASLLTTELLNCKQSITDVLVDKTLVSEFSNQQRFFGRESAAGVRTINFDKVLGVEGSQIKLRVFINSRFDVVSAGVGLMGPENFLRTQRRSLDLELTLFQKKSSGLVFASLGPYGGDQGSDAISLHGVAKCGADRIGFDWEDTGFEDYEIEKSNSILSKSKYLVEWLNTNGTLEEISNITTWEVDPISLEKRGVLGNGWAL
jgi:hypothetical protein